MFLQMGLDRQKHETLLICPSGKSIWSAPFVIPAFAGDDSMCRVNISADYAKLIRQGSSICGEASSPHERSDMREP
jgi:hypothetical protein